jgi:hypothetical protein
MSPTSGGMSAITAASAALRQFAPNPPAVAHKSTHAAIHAHSRAASPARLRRGQYSPGITEITEICVGAKSGLVSKSVINA